MSGGHLEVPVVYYDLRRQEGLFQVFDSLETLNSVVEEVFNRINTRVRWFLFWCYQFYDDDDDDDGCWCLLEKEKKNVENIYLFVVSEKNESENWILIDFNLNLKLN